MDYRGNGMKGMSKNIKKWCYGGQSPAFFAAQQQAIHAYNSRIMSGLLPLMTVILACYLALSMVVPPLSQCTPVYLSYFIALALMLVFFKVKGRQTIFCTKFVIGLVYALIYSFVTLIGTISKPDTSAVMFSVFLLTAPMLVIAPIHHIYAFLSAALAVFSIIAVRVKTPPYPQMDIINGITCLILGFFLSQRVLESRISLLATNEQLDKLSKFDTLTEISNRRGLDEYLRQVYSSCETMSLAMIDIDNFKKYNDTFGHPCGDAALKNVAKTLQRYAAESGCFVARFGGEEFVLIDAGENCVRACPSPSPQK
jgi:predicted signal transduction protein with EAL and GGDEF domain